MLENHSAVPYCSTTVQYPALTCTTSTSHFSTNGLSRTLAWAQERRMMVSRVRTCATHQRAGAGRGGDAMGRKALAHGQEKP